MRLLPLILLFVLQLDLNNLCAKSPNGVLNWKSSVIIAPTERKPARTAVLIIAPPKMGDDIVHQRWQLGKKVWEQYMNSHPYVDCYFVQCADPRKEYENSNQVWIEGNTIYVGDPWYEIHGNDRILHKTIVAMELLLPNYTHFIRTNLNTFFNLQSVNEYMETHHQSMYTATLWQKEWYTIGYGIIYTADVADHIINDYRKLEAAQEDLVNCYQPDDCVITSLATGVCRLKLRHPFQCCPTLPSGTRQLMCESSFAATRMSRYGALLVSPLSLKSAMKYCDLAPETMMLYRIKGDFSLNELAQLYQHLLRKHYPNLSCIDLVEFVNLPH